MIKWWQKRINVSLYFYAKYALRCGTPLFVEFLNFIAMSSRSICSLRSIGDKAWRIMKEIARLRSKEAPSTRELPNYDEKRRKRQTGPALYTALMLHVIFSELNQLKRLFFKALFFKVLVSLLWFYFISCFTTE